MRIHLGCITVSKPTDKNFGTISFKSHQFTRPRWECTMRAPNKLSNTELFHRLCTLFIIIRFCRKNSITNINSKLELMLTITFHCLSNIIFDQLICISFSSSFCWRRPTCTFSAPTSVQSIIFCACTHSFWATQSVQT